jgi:hypothetical protein
MQPGIPMNKLEAVEQAIIRLDLPSDLSPVELRHTAEDMLWQASEMKSARALMQPVTGILAKFGQPNNPLDCEEVAATIWEIAHA